MSTRRPFLPDVDELDGAAATSTDDVSQVTASGSTRPDAGACGPQPTSAAASPPRLGTANARRRRGHVDGRRTKPPGWRSRRRFSVQDITSPSAGSGMAGSTSLLVRPPRPSCTRSPHISFHPAGRDPLCDVVRIESDEIADLDVRDPPLRNEASHVALGDRECRRHDVHPYEMRKAVQCRVFRLGRCVRFVIRSTSACTCRLSCVHLISLPWGSDVSDLAGPTRAAELARADQRASVDAGSRPRSLRTPNGFDDRTT